MITIWDRLANAFIEMQQTNMQAIIKFPKNPDEYFVWNMDFDKKEIILLSIDEPIFGNFKIRMDYSESSDYIIVSDEKNQTLLGRVVSAILDKNTWIQCQYIEVSHKDHINRMYLRKVGTRSPEPDKETGRTLKFDVKKQQFVFIR